MSFPRHLGHMQQTHPLVPSQISLLPWLAAGCSFNLQEVPLEEPIAGQYVAATRFWAELRQEFLFAVEQARTCSRPHARYVAGWMQAASCYVIGASCAGTHLAMSQVYLAQAKAVSGAKLDVKSLWLQFWNTEQRFWQQMVTAAKGPGLVRMAQVGCTPIFGSRRVACILHSHSCHVGRVSTDKIQPAKPGLHEQEDQASGKSVIIGLQMIGEANARRAGAAHPQSLPVA